MSVREWDNHNSYAFGEIVYFSQKYWRAIRDVRPPFLPSLMDGDVPGDSDAWREISAAEVLGAFASGLLGSSKTEQSSGTSWFWYVLGGVAGLIGWQFVKKKI